MEKRLLSSFPPVALNLQGLGTGGWAGGWRIASSVIVQSHWARKICVFALAQRHRTWHLAHHGGSATIGIQEKLKTKKHKCPTAFTPKRKKSLGSSSAHTTHFGQNDGRGAAVYLVQHCVYSYVKDRDALTQSESAVALRPRHLNSRPFDLRSGFRLATQMPPYRLKNYMGERVWEESDAKSTSLWQRCAVTSTAIGHWLLALSSWA